MCSLVLLSTLWAPDVHAACHKVMLFILVFIFAAAFTSCEAFDMQTCTCSWLQLWGPWLGQFSATIRGFYLHAPFLADHFQTSWHGDFQATDCSAGHILLTVPSCVGTSLWVLFPLGSPAIAPRQCLAEQRWR